MLTASPAAQQQGAFPPKSSAAAAASGTSGGTSDDRAILDRLTVKVSQEDTKKAIKQHHKDAKESKKRNVSDRLEQYMDSYRKGERPYIFAARLQGYLRP